MALSEQFADLIEDFAKDPKKESEGVWMAFGRHQFQVARAHRNNVAFMKMMEQELRPYQWAIERNDWDAIKEVAAEALKKVYSKTILRGIRKLDGTPLDYTPEDGEALFTKLPDLWDAVFKYAGTDKNYAPDKVVADSKN